GGLFCRIYDVTPPGNFEGKNIPNLISRSVEEWAAELQIEPAALWSRLDGMRERLREARSRRVWPGLDDKVLTSWNGLMIRAMAGRGGADAGSDERAVLGCGGGGAKRGAGPRASWRRSRQRRGKSSARSGKEKTGPGPGRLLLHRARPRDADRPDEEQRGWRY